MPFENTCSQASHMKILGKDAPVPDRHPKIGSHMVIGFNHLRKLITINKKFA
jgi:hypothetical protein